MGAVVPDSKIAALQRQALPRRDRTPLVIGDVFRHAARTVPHRAAVALGDRQLTFGEIDRRANRLARTIRHEGLATGDVLACWTATDLDVVPLFAATAKAGVVFAPLDPGLSSGEVAGMLAAASPAMLVADAGRLEDAIGLGAVGDVAVEGLESLVRRSAAEPAEDYVAPTLTDADAQVACHSIGRGGRPQWAVVSHLVAYLRSHPGALAQRRGPTVCSPPLVDLGAWTLALQQFQASALLVLGDGTDAEALVAAVAAHGSDAPSATPARWRGIVSLVERDPGGEALLSTVEVAEIFAAAAPPALLAAMRRAMPGAELRIVYGSAEAGAVALLADVDVERKPGSCGLPGVATEVRLERSGELLVRSPMLFDGYLADPDATATALEDGWYRTGDVAEIDGDGYLTILGRVHDLIRAGGESVAPAEVETALAAMAGVDDVAVVGLQDERDGEVVCAAIVMAPGVAPPSLERVRQHCAGRLAPSKQPRRLVVLDEIPRTASGREVQRRLLVELLG